MQASKDLLFTNDNLDSTLQHNITHISKDIIIVMYISEKKIMNKWKLPRS